MNCNKCYNGINVILAVIISTIVGVAVGILFSFGLIPVTLNLIRIALIISVIAIGILLSTILSANFSRECKVIRCICWAGKMLLIGAIGTLLSGTIVAVIGLTEVPVLSAVFVGLTAFFFIWTILYIIFLIKCLICKICERE